MPQLASELAAAAAAQESLIGVPRSYVPHPRPAGLSEKDIAYRVIGEGEVLTELEATQRLAKFGLDTNPKLIVNSTTEPIAWFLSKGFWMWDDWKLGTLRRARVTPRPRVRTVYRPSVTSDSREVRQLRKEVGQLRAAVAGSEGRLPVVRVDAGRALIRNPHRWGFSTSPVGPLEALEVVECDADLVQAATQSGVLFEISAQECAELIAANA